MSEFFRDSLGVLCAGRDRVAFTHASEWKTLDRKRSVTVGRMRAIGALVHQSASSPVVTTCEHCHGLRFDLGGPHAVRVTPAGRFDCKGQRVA